ncbi:MAG: hypothetical protein KatS3mg118_2248 [Paracoccaceae bacterium]|nr:MAG: hypothetical protein KatS3mg118_2248 [Paracoccaceae bacterium]
MVSDEPRHAPPEARSVGLMFQDFALFPHLTVAENVAFGLRRIAARPRRGPRWWRELPGAGGAGGLSGRQVSPSCCRGASSSGWRWRGRWRPEAAGDADGRALLGARSTGCATSVRDETLGILKEEGAGVLLVTHEPEEAMRMADRIALMRRRADRAGGVRPMHMYNRPADRRRPRPSSRTLNVIHGDGARRAPGGHALRPVPDAGVWRMARMVDDGDPPAAPDGSDSDSVAATGRRRRPEHGACRHPRRAWPARASWARRA